MDRVTYTDISGQNITNWGIITYKLYILKLTHYLSLLQLHRKHSNLIHLFYKTWMLVFLECVIEEPRLHREDHRPYMGYPTLFYAWPWCPINPASAAVGYSHWAPLKETKEVKCVGCRTETCDLLLASALPNWANQMAVPPITTPGFFDAWIIVCVCVLMIFFFFFDLGFTALSRIFHLYWANRSSKVGENRTQGKTTWPSVSRTWLSHMWPERDSNHSGEKWWNFSISLYYKYFVCICVCSVGAWVYQ